MNSSIFQVYSCVPKRVCLSTSVFVYVLACVCGCFKLEVHDWCIISECLKGL